MITGMALFLLFMVISFLAAAIWVFVSVGWELALVLALVAFFLSVIGITNWCDVHGRRGPFDPKRGWGFRWRSEQKPEKIEINGLAWKAEIKEGKKDKN